MLSWWLPESVSTYGPDIDRLFYAIYYITNAVFLAVSVEEEEGDERSLDGEEDGVGDVVDGVEEAIDVRPVGRDAFRKPPAQHDPPTRRGRHSGAGRASSSANDNPSPVTR